jgi:NADPH-dependent 2,4-dienoyl-CoA reductase/sulfur reductase-like enzyme/rhodanese-related sulfurtransferase
MVRPHRKRIDMKILIVGGVAGGASCAARARRMSEDAEIIVFEKGPYVSFANCGLPYYVGHVIEDEESLLVATPELFQTRFRVDVRLQNEVVKIDRGEKEIHVKSLSDGKLYQESYDALVLSPGAYPIRPALPGVDLPGIFTLRTIPDSRAVKHWIEQKKAKRAAVIGAGYIGLEMTENLARLGIQVSILELQSHVLPLFDSEMTVRIEEHLKAKGVSVFLNDAVAGFEATPGGGLIVSAKSGRKIETDMVVLAMGVKPDVKLAQEAGLEIGTRGGIRVNEFLQTSDPAVWAVGDAIETRDFVTGGAVVIPLAGPANRQGRIAAENMLGRKRPFRGIQGTAVCQVFDMTAALTGATEKTLKRLNLPYEKIYLYPNQHAAYYPGACSIDLKLLFSPKTGQVLGAQAVGEKGVEKRIDVIAAAIQMKANVFELEEAELCYAPQFGSAKDPVNLAGMIAANALRGDAPVVHWEELDPKRDFLLDVRSKGEFEKGHAEGAILIPLPDLRANLDSLPKDRDLHVYCGVGQRGHYATRLLRLRGFRAHNISGGYRSYLKTQGKK